MIFLEGRIDAWEASPITGMLTLIVLFIYALVLLSGKDN